MSIGLFGLFALLSCVGEQRGESCETPKCSADENIYGFNEAYQPVVIGKFNGCSMPGCAGCLTCGHGCGCFLWPQALKISSASLKDGSSIKGCDISYYDGCLGCFSDSHGSQSCFSGCVNGFYFEKYKPGKGQQGYEFNGCFCGDTGCSNYEADIGCLNGCIGCSCDMGLGHELIKQEVDGGLYKK